MRTYRKVPQNLQGITPKWWWSDNSKGNQLEQTPSVFFAHWSSEKSESFPFKRDLTLAFQRHPSLRLHPQLRCMCMECVSEQHDLRNLAQNKRILSYQWDFVKKSKEIHSNFKKKARQPKAGWIAKRISQHSTRDSGSVAITTEIVISTKN